MAVDVHYDPAMPSVSVLDCSEDYATARMYKVYGVLVALVALPLLTGFMNGWVG